MGKQISTIQVSGKLGNIVGYGTGKARIRRTQIANPRSTGQSIQRMILATVGVAIAYLREICNNSVEGKKYGGETLAYLRGQWMRMLRVSNILDASNTYSYIAKGSQLFANNPYMVSRGSLTSINASLDSYANSAVVNGLGVASASVVASALFPMVAVGNQITIIAVSYDDGHDTPNWIFTKYCRFAFKDNTTPALIANTLNTEGGFLINPEAIDLTKAEGDWDKLVFKTTQGQIDLTYLNGDIAAENGYDVIGCAIIQSNLVNGKRSTEYLSVSSGFTHLSASEAYLTFGDGGTEINVPSDVYLNNSTTAAAETSPEESHILYGDHSLPYIVLYGQSVNNTISNVPGTPSEAKLKVKVGETEYYTANLMELSANDSIFEDGDGPDQVATEYTLVAPIELSPEGEINIIIHLNETALVETLIVEEGSIKVDGVDYSLA